MKKFMFILIASILTIVKSSSGFANDNYERCNITPRPKIIFKTSYGKLKYDHTKSDKELEQMTGKRISGLASLQYKSSTQVLFEIREYKSGFCVVPKEANIYVGIIEPVIYVSNELKAGDCDYNVVLRHEEAHMQINIRTFEHFLKVAPKALKKVTQDIKPIYAKNKEAAQRAADYINYEYSVIIENFTQQLQDETDIEHEKLDGARGRHLESQICKKDVLLH